MFQNIKTIKWLPAWRVLGFLWVLISTSCAQAALNSAVIEPIQACVMSNATGVDSLDRASLPSCLGWVDDERPLCRGYYQSLQVPSLNDPRAIEVMADRVSLTPSGHSHLVGNVEVRQTNRIVNAQTATIYRDAKSQQVTRIELLGQVRYVEPGRLMRARRALIYPKKQLGHLEEVYYRFDLHKMHAILPAWGKARWVERLPNEDYRLRDVTYTTCSVRDRSWYISARELLIHRAQGYGVAKHARLHVADFSLLSLPDFSFPTSNARKSGFLVPMAGYSNVGGFDLALPYYWNMAPNVDTTITPHAYSRRGMMFGGNTRFLTEKSSGVIGGQFLPGDAAFNQFLMHYHDEFPILKDVS